MEEKKFSSGNNSLRFFYGLGSINKFIIRAGNIFSSLNLPGTLESKNKKSLSFLGFTLVELLVVIAMLAVMATIILGVLNPLTQIQKAKDAQRKEDLKQIANALDLYYNDNNYYPQVVPFRNLWKVGTVSYMQKVPQDANCGSGSSCYAYLIDTTAGAKPQWNVLFAKLNEKVSTAVLCPLEQINATTPCLPTNYKNLGYNYCFLSGKVDCSYIISHAISPSN